MLQPPLASEIILSSYASFQTIWIDPHKDRKKSSKTEEIYTSLIDISKQQHKQQ